MPSPHCLLFADAPPALAQIDALRVVAARLLRGALELCKETAEDRIALEGLLEAQLQEAEEKAAREAAQRLVAEQRLAACQTELEQV
jgi:hypothetical protein